MMNGYSDNLALGYTLGRDANGGSSNGGMGSWGAESWWFIIVLFALWGGFGGNGFGGGGNAATQGALTRSDLCQDMNFQEVKREIQNANDAVNLGFSNLNSTICNQQYDTARMINGLQGTIQGGFNATNVALLQGQNALATQIAGCCCEAQQTMAGINYNLSTQACDTRNTIQNSTRDIIDSQNANARAILDKLTAQELAAKDAQIAAQNQQIFGLQLAASQEKQNSTIINTLRPFPVASYQVCNPFTGTYGGYQSYGAYGNCGCGCGCGTVA